MPGTTRPPTRERLRGKLDELRDSYARSLPDKLASVQRAAEAIVRRDGSPENVHELRHVAHGLAGSGSTFGFPGVSEVARELELLADTILARSEATPGPREITALHEHVEALRLAAAEPARRERLALPDAERAVRASSHGPRLIYLVEDDPLVAEKITGELEHFGYAVQTFDGTGRVLEALEQVRPAAIIADVMFPEGELAGPALVTRIRESLEREPPPVLFVSARSDLRARIEAIRAGGRAYLTKPLDPVALVDKLDAITAPVTAEPIRTLVVDRAEGQRIAATLEAAGMLAESIDDPSHMTRMLAELAPDIVLIDDGIEGFAAEELARVIHQHEGLVGVPVIFLVEESEALRRATRLPVGADGLIIRTTDDDDLIESVRRRVEHSRTLRLRLVRDSLTGLLNHAAIMERLSSETLRAKRQGAPLTLAVIDLDEFKQVNDRFGHLVGDRVLKSVARLLRERLRCTDSIGRHGGDELAIVMPETSGVSAARVLEGIRISLARTSFRAGEERFSVTASVGIAVLPPAKSPVELLRAADAALYQAKENGRDRIVVAAKR